MRVIFIIPPNSTSKKLATILAHPKISLSRYLWIQRILIPSTSHAFQRLQQIVTPPTEYEGQCRLAISTQIGIMVYTLDFALSIHLHCSTYETLTHHYLFKCCWRGNCGKESFCVTMASEIVGPFVDHSRRNLIVVIVNSETRLLTIESS